MAKRKVFSAEQIIMKLREAKVLLGLVNSILNLKTHFGIAPLGYTLFFMDVLIAKTISASSILVIGF